MQRNKTPSSPLSETLPSAAQQRLAQAMDALRGGRPDEALRSLSGALAMAPNSMRIRYFMGVALHMQGDFASSMRWFEEVVAHEPENAAAWMGLGVARHDLHADEEALNCLQRACSLQPDSIPYRYNLGKAMHDQRKAPAEVGRVMLDVLRSAPEHINARVTLADTQISTGCIREAVENYREILRRQPTHAKAWLGLADIKTFSFSSEDLKGLRDAWRQTPERAESRITLGFALAKAYEDQADYASAFETLRKANAAVHARERWNAEAERAYVKAIERAFPSGQGGDADPSRGEEIIFVVSLPRSGSTLVEQILASHPEVEGGGEIRDLQAVIDEESARRGHAFPDWVPHATPEDWARLGHVYLERTGYLREKRSRSTDKNLLNWKLVGAVRAMLPGARIIDVRRDPLETCLACYRQYFRQGNHFSYDLEDMAGFWKNYDRLSRHWAALFPESCLPLTYEKLLDAPEATIRQLLDFCGLPFDPACLSFHETERVVRTASAAQVRQPLQRDTARAHHYAEALEPLRTLLKVEHGT
ncbi:tetratricopeptide repeat protein [Oleiagrimonas citrea]|uniref:Tetratricopeptide repeat protein n=1 Tax=Oleiagrimonas citrea TaxID=1665687 RepID=A0A846ZRD1_9GAMM|nr:tetratricopeptide repeat protein [Oleiagrimonas citrea]